MARASLLLDLKCKQKASGSKRQGPSTADVQKRSALPAGGPGRGWEGLILDLGS